MSLQAQQILTLGGQYYNINHTSDSSDYVASHDGLDILRKHCALGARHDSNDRLNPPKCDPDTRVIMIEKIMAWIFHSSSTMLWLHGSLGVGKSALAQSVAELCCKRGCLAGSFFFSKKAGNNRSDGRLLIPTLVYQLVSSIPDIGPLVKQIFKRDPSILTRSIETQMQRLFVEPLNRVTGRSLKIIFSRTLRPKVIVIDGFDECSDQEVRRTVLKVFSNSLQSLRFPLRILITSRPEVDITQIFTSLPAPPLQVLDLSGDSRAESDIDTFLRKEFDEIKKTHPFLSYIPESWPNDQNIAELVRRCSGQFIYASTVIKYIRCASHHPVERLKVILGLSPRPMNDTPYAELDVLYMDMLSSVRCVAPVLKILGILFIPRTSGDDLGDYYSPISLERLLSLRTGQVVEYLAPLVSVLTTPSGSPNSGSPNDSIRILHASLADFLFDQSRAGNFYCDKRLSHSLLASGFMKYVLPSNFSLEDALSNQGDDPYCHSYWDSVVAHLKMAVETKDLRRDFLNLICAYPESQFHFQRQKYKTLSHEEKATILDYSWSWITSLFRCLVEAEIFQSISDRVLLEFDQYHKQHVIHSAAHHDLANMLTMFVLYDDPPVSLPSRVLRMAFLAQSEAHGQSLWTLDEDGLNIGVLLLMLSKPPEHSYRAPRHCHRLRYIKLLCEFLRDPQRSGEYSVSGAEYATAALECLKSICGPRDCNDRLTFLSLAKRPASGKSAEDQRTLDSAFITFATALLPKAVATEELSSFVSRNGIYSTLLEDFRDEVKQLISAMEGYVGCPSF